MLKLLLLLDFFFLLLFIQIYEHNYHYSVRRKGFHMHMISYDHAVHNVGNI